MTRRTALLALSALVLIAGAWGLLHRPAAPAAAFGVPGCPLATLPREVSDTVRAIRSSGPFPYPGNDGAVFGNHEGHLPDRVRGYYHEYTVITPGARNRAVRRVITGGSPLSHPAQFFYTANHYDSFCLVTDAGG